MNKIQRRKYFGSYWPRACAAQGWEPEDGAKRHQVTRQCMLLCCGPDTDSITMLGEAEITALFTYLRWLARPQNLRLQTGWEACRRDYRAYNVALQGDYWRREAGYRSDGRIMRDRFGNEPLGRMTKTEAEEYLTTMRARAKGRSRRKTKYAVYEEPETDRSDIPF